MARALLGSMFVFSGIDVLKNPEPRAKMADPVIGQMAKVLPALPDDRVQVVRANAALQVVAGGLLAVGRLPRLAAAALAGSLVPTTLGGHRFWELDDPREIAQQRIHVLKNAAILGGLLLAAETGGGHDAKRHQASSPGSGIVAGS